MKNLILAATTLLLMTSVEGREHWGPPSNCPQPKVDCCPKPKCPPPCAPKPCEKPKPCKPACKPAPCKPACKPEPCKPVCKPQCDPCCPPVCFERGHATSNCCIPSAYVEPANIDLRCGANVYFTASFIYWEVMQGGMDIAIPGQAVSANPLVGNQESVSGKHILYQDQDFKPGFQVGFGWSGGRDGWGLYGEYTWVRGETNTSATPPAPGVTQVGGIPVGQAGIWFPTSWFSGIYQNNNSTNFISSKWQYAMDIADLQMSRPSYIGTHLILEPLFGLRGLWIRQDMDLQANILPYTTGFFPPTRTAQYKSHSWAVGPRAGFNGKWMMGYGLRFIGDASASLLFTQYTEVSQDVQSSDPIDPLFSLPINLKIENYNTLRPNLEFSLGLGWGSYFSCRRIHWDLAATYDFAVFWEQNMMRYLADMSADFFAHPSTTPANLYIQGLTVKTELEF